MLQRLLKTWFRFVPVLLVLGCQPPASTPPAATPPSEEVPQVTEEAPAPPPEPEVRVLRLGATPWVPFTAEQGQPRVASYLVERALERAGYKAESSIVADGALTPALKEGRFDGSSAMWLSEDREQFLLYSKPYLENRLHLVARKGSDVSAKSFAELKGKRIAIVAGYAYGPELESAKEPIFVPVANAQENLRAVMAGRVDYCLLDALLVEFLFEHSPKETAERLAVGSSALVRRTLHFAVQKSLPDAARIIERFDAAVQEMTRDGTYNLALQVTWISTDVDGDGRVERVAPGGLVGTAPPARSYQLFESTPGNPGASAAPSVMTVDEQTRYYVNGQAYDSWEQIPDALKLQPHGNQVGAGHPQVKLIEW